MSDITDYVVAIRSSNERTEGVCKEMVGSQLSGQKYSIIHKEPFKLALETCFKTALQQRSKWLITVDADMLILPGALKRLYESAEQMPEHYLQLQGRIFDKITGAVRKAGPRIYRVNLLEKALNISEKSEDQIRPEAHVVTALGKAGHPSRYISSVTCLHDFEQYYADLYRKSIVHSKKHHEFIAKIISRAAENMQEDDDFKVILKAVWDGLTETGEVSIDSRLYQDKAKEALLELNLTEKPEIRDLDEIFEKRQRWVRQIPGENLDYTNENFHDQPKPHYPFFKRVKNITAKKGVIGGGMYGLGEMLLNLGRRLQ